MTALTPLFTPLLTRRAALAASLGTLALTACKAGGSRATRLEDATLHVATYKGQIDTLFQDAGVPAPAYRLERAFFAGGNQIVEALNAGAVDFGGMSEIPPIFVAGANPALRLIAVQQYDVNNQTVLVPAGSPIRTLAQLRGKRIGYVRATTSHYILLRVLDEVGLTFADITPVALSPQDGLAAFGKGQLDAWVIYGVHQALAVKGGARVLANGKGRLSGNYVLATSTDALADPIRVRAIADYIDRMARTWAWTVAEPEKWAAANARATGVPADIWLQQFRGRSTDPRIVPVTPQAIASQQQVADRFAAAGIIPAKVDVTPLWSTALNGDLEKLAKA